MNNFINICEECGHKSFHPIRWIKSFFIKFIDVQQVPLKPYQRGYWEQKLLKTIEPLLIFDKFMDCKPLPKVEQKTIKFRRYGEKISNNKGD